MDRMSTGAAFAPSLPSSESSASGFYPTPAELANRLLSGVDWKFVQSTLEPSAGKGDLAEAVLRLRKAYVKYDPKALGIRELVDACDMDCVEIDPHLRAILKDRGFRVVGDDFLRFRTCKRYSLIVMNPPFHDGAKHVLKALEMQRHGGAVYAILNAETLRNPCTHLRRTLMEQLDRYHAEIEYVPGAFAEAQRKTSVEAALIRCVIPAQVDDSYSHILEALRREDDLQEDCSQPEMYGVAKGDYIQAAAERFQYETRVASEFIREWHRIEHLFAASLDGEDKYAGTVLSLSMPKPGRGESEPANVNGVVRALRKKYWRALFQHPKFTHNLTSSLREELFSRVEEMQNYDFSLYNIYSLRLELQKHIVKGVEDTIMALFDDWTRKYHWDENSSNLHYFDGWRTNDAFAVNEKVIIPFYSCYDDSFHQFRLDSGRCIEKLEDIQKVFDFLNGCPGHTLTVAEILRQAKRDGVTRNIAFPYFTATFYKKRTCHIRFTDLDTLKKFNLFAAQGKHWLPPSYGRKRYRDFTPEEKAVVDSFEGEKSYNETLSRADYFLARPSVAMLENGRERNVKPNDKT